MNWKKTNPDVDVFLIYRIGFYFSDAFKIHCCSILLVPFKLLMVFCMYVFSSLFYVWFKKLVLLCVSYKFFCVDVWLISVVAVLSRIQIFNLNESFPGYK